MTGRAYLDHASTSPARPQVIEAMLPWWAGDHAGDPGRVHTEGRMARAAVEDARDSVAALVGARNREVVFTSGATEAINAAVFGALAASAEHGGGRRVVAAAVEHSAVLDSSRRAGEVTTVPVDRLGRIDAAAFVAALAGGDVALAHVQWANHEVGTLQPVGEIVAACRERGVLVHVDAAQAGGHVAIGFADLGADLLSISAHKFGGPKGAGALLVRRGLRLPALIVGGEQERARRGGIENVPAIIGFGAAASAVDVAGEAGVQSALVDRIVAAATAVDGVVSFGDRSPGGRLPHLACFGIDDVEAEPVLLALDQAGIAVHSGSSCSSESLEPSPVLEAMGVEAERSLRVSVGWSTTDADVDAFLAAFPAVLDRLRALRRSS
ncbi:MAG TPA: cysteine desulfurase family protein [Acidimicrobiales bacterium]|nr:cysteine desulfurase family protein [Acidimicrobiales bacterium]